MITECLSQTQIVTNLLRLQNTTFQTCSRSKYSPIIPRLIFKASLFSPSLLPPQIPEPRAAQRERERDRGDEGERLNLAFREWSGRCLEIFHILFTPGRFQPRDRRELARPSAWTQLLSLFSICLPRPERSRVCKPFHAASLPSTPSNLKQTNTRRLARSASPAARGGTSRILIKKNPFYAERNAATQHPL